MKNAYSRIEELKEQLDVKESSAAEAQEKLAQLELELEEQQTYVDTYKVSSMTAAGTHLSTATDCLDVLASSSLQPG